MTDELRDNLRDEQQDLAARIVDLMHYMDNRLLKPSQKVFLGKQLVAMQQYNAALTYRLLERF